MGNLKRSQTYSLKKTKKNTLNNAILFMTSKIHLNTNNVTIQNFEIIVKVAATRPPFMSRVQTEPPF